MEQTKGNEEVLLDQLRKMGVNVELLKKANLSEDKLEELVAALGRLLKEK